LIPLRDRPALPWRLRLHGHVDQWQRRADRGTLPGLQDGRGLWLLPCVGRWDPSFFARPKHMWSDFQYIRAMLNLNRAPTW